MEKTANSDIERLTAWHRAQLGTREEPAGSNRVRYNTRYYGREVSGSAYPWCMAYQWCGFDECGLGSLFYGGGKTASCGALMRRAKKDGQFVTEDYREGDIILLRFSGAGGPEHTGYCTGATEGCVYTIEGNCDDAVMEKKRAEKYVIGAFRPDYEGTGEKTVTVKLPVLKTGSRGESVRTLQLALSGRGCDIGECGADGIFGPGTKAAVIQFQKAAGIEEDGICGAQTYGALFPAGGEKCT